MGLPPFNVAAALRSFKANPALIAELAADKLLEAATEAQVARAVAAAKAAAPVDEGDYRDSIKAVPGDGDTIARITSDDYKAHWIEWGTVHQPPRAPLRSGVLAAGLTFKESSR